MINPWVVRNIIYPHIFGMVRGVTGRDIMRHVERFEAQAKWSPERREEETLRRIRALLNHAVAQVPIWREKFRSVGAEPDDIRSWDDFARLPTLTREEVHGGRQDCLAQDLDRESFYMAITSGSTGMRVAYAIDRAREPLHYANVHFNHRWLGVEVGEPEAHLWGDVGFPTGPRSWRRRLTARLIRRMFFHAQELDEDLMNLFHRRMTRFRPVLLSAFPTMASLFVHHCRRNSLPLPKLRAIISTGEVLTEEDRETIGQAFQTDVHNRYGSIELGDIAHECPIREGLHINTHRVWVEVLSDKNLDGDLGRILVTDLDNRAMPLVRYETGDLGRLWPTETTHLCACGRTLPRLAEVVGRVVELVQGPTGKWYSRMSFTMPRRIVPGIVNVQVVLRLPRTVIFRCQVDEFFPANGQERIAQIIHDNTDHQFDVTVEQVDRLIRTQAGKLRGLIIE